MRAEPARGAPPRTPIEGRYVRLEPLAQHHAQDLFDASSGEGIPERYRFLSTPAPRSAEDVSAFVETASANPDWSYFAVVEPQSERALGRQAFMSIAPQHASIEIGGIYWGPGMARTRLATEAFHLFAKTAFGLGYRRFQWQCNSLNQNSRDAAARFGFTYEGTFRQDKIIKGESRDTAWFSIIDSEWPALDAEFERWLSPENFEADGTQKSPLAARRA